MTIEDLINRTKEIAQKFPVTNWTPETRTLDLVEEVGELCSAILEYHGHKTVDTGSKEAIVDGLCDILFDLILLFQHYQIDIKQEYSRTLDDFENRIKRNEWGGANGNDL